MDNHIDIVFPTRYLAKKHRDESLYFNNWDKIIKVCDGFQIMAPWEYKMWKANK